MARLIVAAALAAAGFAAPAATATGCTAYSCCIPHTDVCWEVQQCYCPYDGCWCLPGGGKA